jgi:hypothetical protein
MWKFKRIVGEWSIMAQTQEIKNESNKNVNNHKVLSQQEWSHLLRYVPCMIMNSPKQQLFMHALLWMMHNVPNLGNSN